ncbi:hypothetical protein LTR86_003625 [Recurvomyces mirabilis]|nr:hypothetical protein LTR86_003625 [Recurvomyces mirabilis]
MAATPTQPSPQSIPIIAIGKTRATALALSSFFSAPGKETPYYLAAVLDMTESPEEYQFSAKNFGAALWAMHPRPRAVVCGLAVGEEFLGVVEGVWGEFVREALLDGEGEGKGSGGVVALHRWHPTTGPPPPGLEEELLRQLDALFRD